MTTVVVVAELPGNGTVLPALQPEPLSSEKATALYRAMLADICETVLHGEADLLVNYPAPERVPDGVDPESELREYLNAELPTSDGIRYEVQVGVVEPMAPLLRREHVGTVAMKLRTSDVVLGPAQGGRLYFAGFTAAVDFEDAYADPALETMTARALDAGLSVEFLPMVPRADSPEGLASTVSLIQAQSSAGRIVPSRTAALFEEWGLGVDDGGVSTSSDRS